MLISVKMLKISRTRLKQLGYDLSDGGVAGLLNRDGAPAANAEPSDETPVVANPVAAHLVESRSRSRTKALLDSWKKQRIVVQEFGEQTVATASGRPAFMHIGGEFPILVPANQGAFTIQMKKFGRQLDVVPQLLDSGRVRLEIRPRVSEIDETRAVKIKDVVVPGLRVYEIDAAVEVALGQTFAVSGSSQTDEPQVNQPPQAPRDEAPEQFELLVLAQVELVDEMTPLEDANGTAVPSETPR
jgi:pilus assembly protein CpaC